MVCVPCIFVGLAIVIWCKFLEPYVKPIYERLCQYYPPFRNVGNLIAYLAVKLEMFGEKIGIRMPESCPMPKKNRNTSKGSTTEKNKHDSDLQSTTADMDVHHRATSAAAPSSNTE